MGKLAVIFPGMGYHPDKPLLLYSAKLAAAAGYDIVKITYPPCKEIDREHMRPYVEECIKAAEEALEGIDLSGQEDILFLSKSIGTVTATAYARFHKINARQVLFTPLEETFIHASDGCGIAFSGTKDQWTDHEKIREFCAQNHIPMTAVVNGNHSLETGDVMRDIEILQSVMQSVKSYITM